MKQLQLCVSVCLSVLLCSRVLVAGSDDAELGEYDTQHPVFMECDQPFLEHPNL